MNENNFLLINISKKIVSLHFLIQTHIDVKINYEKVKEDEKWDGLKGYITNTDLSASDVYKQY